MMVDMLTKDSLACPYCIGAEVLRNLRCDGEDCILNDLFILEDDFYNGYKECKAGHLPCSCTY